MSGLANMLQDLKMFNLAGQTFIGEVLDNEDPESEDRLKIRVDNLYDHQGDTTLLPWAIPFRSVLFGNTANVGTFGTPVVGSIVLVILLNGDPHAPAYIGSVTTPGTKKGVGGRGKYGFQDPNGSLFILDTNEGTYSIQLTSGLTLNVDSAGKLTVSGPDVIALLAQSNIELVAQKDCTVSAQGDVNIVGADVNVSGDTINLN